MLLRDVVVKIAAGSVLVTPSKTLMEMPREKWGKSAILRTRFWPFRKRLENELLSIGLMMYRRN